MVFRSTSLKAVIMTLLARVATLLRWQHCYVVGSPKVEQ
jgi:hypothetical protein